MGESICFGFSLALPAAGKGVFVFFEPCPSWASRLFFQFAFVRRGQASVFLKTLQIFAF
jgi:hypothetical protein